MRKRLTVGVLALFWVTMMVLLWRSEFGGGTLLGTRMPPDVVWDRILTAPDTSTLEIRHGTNRVGYCRWRADVGQEYATGAIMADPEDPLEGMVRNLAYYSLDIDGNVAIAELGQRARFVVHLKLDTNQVWQELSIRVGVRPDTYEVSASAADQKAVVRVDAGADKWERTIKFSELQNPQKLLAEVGGPALPLLLAMMGSAATSTNDFARSLGARWEAHNDTMLLGRNRVRVYRLQASLLDRFKAVLYVSPVGEIMRIELPANLALINDHLLALRTHD